MKLRAALVAVAIGAASLLGAPAYAAQISLGIAYDIGGRGDRSFNDAAAAGLEKAQKNFTFSVDPVVTDGTPADRERRVRSLIAKNCNPIVVVGAGYAPLIRQLAVEFPDTQFAILNDATVEALNVTSLVFDDTQGAFLAGYAAALATKTNKVTMIASPSQADIYLDGFLAGVLASKKTVSSTVRYTTGSVASLAKVAMDSGVDVIYVARPGSDTEVFQTIVSRNLSKAKSASYKPVGLISIEPDQYVTVTSATKKFLYATVVKRVDKAMYDVIARAISGDQYLDVLDPVAGIYGHRYGINGGGIEFKTYLPALSAQSASINTAALQAVKISK
jgi:basic membrane protein A